MTEEGKPVKLLILEDMDSDLELIHRQLKKAGLHYEAQCVKTREAFEASLASTPPDLVISDFQLPQFTGMEALKIVKDRTPLTPFIIFTGTLRDEELAVKLIKMGTEEYVLKENPVRLSSAVRNALEKRKAQQTLQAAEDKIKANEVYFRSLIENTMDLITIVDGLGLIQFETPSIERILGYRQDELIGQRAFDFVHPDDLAHILEVFAEGMNEPTNLRIAEYRFKHKEGHWVYLESWGKIISKDEHLTNIIINSRDVTERKKSDKVLSEEQLFLDTVIKGIPGILYVLNRDGKFLKWNQNMCKITGYSDEEISKMSPSDLGDPADKKLIERKILEVFKKGQSQLEMDLISKDGKRSPFLFNGIHLSQENRDCLIGIGIDLSEQRRLQEELRQSQKMEGIGRLAGGVAHDFNNILTVIMGYSDLLEKNLQPLGGTFREEIQEIQKATERAIALTRQLLAFSRKQIISPRIVDLNELVANVEKMLGRLIGEHIELRFVPGKDLKNVRVDPGQVEQVIMNLAVNSGDAMPEGGKLTIETNNVFLDESYCRQHANLEPGDYVMLAVSDTGCGMSEEVKKHAFEPFFTTKPKGKGTGLGLATTYGIIKQAGGALWIYSEVNRGTTIKIYFPVAAGEIENNEGAMCKLPSHDLSGDETILLVEDEPLLRNLAAKILTTKGYKILEASNGQEALDLLKNNPELKIDMLFTDVVMPQMSGKELQGRILALMPNVKVLFASGYTENGIVDQGILESGVHFIQKPFSPNALANKVREVLNS